MSKPSVAGQFTNPSQMEATAVIAFEAAVGCGALDEFTRRTSTRASCGVPIITMPRTLIESSVRAVR